MSRFPAPSRFPALLHPLGYWRLAIGYPQTLPPPRLLRGLKKQVTTAGNIRFVGETEDSHCDRTWALAPCLHAARARCEVRADVA